ncbi:hypothetical protein [Nitrospira sp. Nam74]
MHVMGAVMIEASRREGFESPRPTLRELRHIEDADFHTSRGQAFRVPWRHAIR